MSSNSGVWFQSFCSGSSGNCYYLGTARGGILIDAGVGVRTLKANLTRLGLSFDDIAAVLVTHDHFDHIRSLGSYCKKLGKPVWMTKELRNAPAVGWMTGEHLAPVLRLFPDEGPAEIIPGLLSATPFVVPHDATQTVGFNIKIKGCRFVIMTDTGAVTEEAMDYASQADTVVIEANYDLYMLRHGSYPKDLQDRICGGHGHLSNDECAAAVKAFMHEGLRNVFLCHLSAQNNTPEAALEAVGAALAGTGVRLAALPRTTTSVFYEL